MKIKFKKLHPDAKPPTRAKAGDAGWDLTCIDWQCAGSDVMFFKTGIAVEIPEGYFGLLRPRSSMARTVYSVATSGVIDSGYRGELIFPLRSTGLGSHYESGDRICQLIILPLPDVEMVEVEELSETERGTGGFGSTGN